MGVFSVGLPERIRTFDLQSRSLTRYPAVPRVGILYTTVLYHKAGKKASPFRKKVAVSRKEFSTGAAKWVFPQDPFFTRLFHIDLDNFSTTCGKLCGHLIQILEISA